MTRTSEGGVTLIDANVGDIAGQLNNRTLADLAKLVAGKASVNVAGSGSYTLGSVVASDSRTLVLVFTGTLTGNRTVVLPATQSARAVIVSNQTTGAYTLTVVTDAVGSTGVTVPRGLDVWLWQDGTNVRAINDTYSAWTSYTPTVTVGSGSLTSYTAIGFYRVVGKWVEMRVSISITNNGTAATNLIISLPVGPSHGTGRQAMCGRESSVTGKVVGGTISPNTSLLTITNYDGSYPGGSGYSIEVQGPYEIA